MSTSPWAESTVASVDIARLAGVGRAAVGNWRRRFADFPDPVGGTASSPLFRLGDVERWLTHHGRAIQVSAVDGVWQWLRTETDDLQLGELVGQLGAFLVFLERDPAAWTSIAATSDGAAIQRAVAATVPELPGGFPDRQDAEWITALRSLAGVVAEQGAATTFRFLTERFLDAHARRLPTTPSSMIDQIVQLAGVQGRSVLDPTCGTGALLIAASAAGATTVAAQDADRSAARLTGAQLLLAGSAVEVRAGDALTSDGFGGRLFDVVVCTPPFSGRDWGYDELAGDPRWEFGLPPRGEPELAWVQHCLAHAEPGGTVVIVMPAGAASRRAGRRIRNNLLRSGALRAVIGQSRESGGAPDLWVLTRPHPDGAAPSHVLMADAADPGLLRSFTTDPASGDTEHSRSVRIIDLLDDDVDLSPARHLPATTGADVDFRHGRAKLLSTLGVLARLLPELDALPTPRDLPMTAIGDLVKAGVVALTQAPLRMTVDEQGEIPVLTVKDVTAGRAPSGWTQVEPGLVLLEPGDVVMPAMAKESVARVITDGGAALGPRLVCFRPDPDRLDAQFLAGFLRLGGSAAPIRTTGLSRTDARRIPVPLMPLDAQAEFGTAFRNFAAFEDALRNCAASGRDLARLGVAGLADGRLIPGQ